MNKYYYKASDLPLKGVHPAGECLDDVVCIMHYPSKHSMSELPIIWRDDRRIFERICPHGVGHPDPDQFDYWDRINMPHEKMHGCDGCCGMGE